MGAALLGVIYFSSFGSRLPLGTAIAVSAIAVGVLFFSVLVHEISHGVVGRWLKRPPESYTLTLLGGHTTFRGPDPSPGVSALISLAGPAANLALAAVAWALTQLPDIGMYFTPVAVVNLILAIFNAAPGLPMDGGHVVAAIGWYATDSREKGLLIGGWAGRVLALLIGGATLAWTAAMGTGLAFDSGVLWMLLISVFLWQGASRSVAVARARMKVVGVDLRPLMAPIPAVEATSSIADIPPTGAVLVDHGWPVGYVSMQALHGDFDRTQPATALSQAIPRRNVITVPVGPDAIAGAAGAEGDTVVLMDSGYYWVGSVRALAQRVPR